MQPTQIYKELLNTYPYPDFTPRTVYNLCLKETEGLYRHDPDEYTSAGIYLDQMSAGPDPIVQRIALPDDQDGYTALAFSVPSFIRKYGERICEIGLDSTWKTNKSGYECFALLGELSGSGLPLGFLLIKSNNPEPGTKEKYICALLRHMREKWELVPIQSLSDKDITEINSCLAELPDDIKHQLCFWHCIRAVRGRLSVVGRSPAHYHIDAAQFEFDFIDPNFVPLAQMKEQDKTPESLFVAQEAIPTVQIRIGDQLMSMAPAKPKIVIHLNGHLRDTLRGLRGLGEESDEREEYFEEEDDGLSDELGDELESMDSDRLEAAPSWLEPGELLNDATVFAHNKSYLFCPAPHRRQLLHLFMRHFCLHPLLPERTRQFRTAQEIRRDSVFEMYKFCFQRGLREVWGYMWEAWYCNAKWVLWARSSQPDFIGRWRTTMAVENFWRNLKHGTLHHLLHPRLDQLVHLIVTDVIPRFRDKMRIFDTDYRPGRARALTPWQTELKKNWKKQAARAVSSNTYTHSLNLSTWTCTCGQQKYNAFLLCKHLVQAVHLPDPQFFREVYRRRVTPFYHHPLLRPKDGSTIDASGFKPSLISGDYFTDFEATRGMKRARGQDTWKRNSLAGSSRSSSLTPEDYETARESSVYESDGPDDNDELREYTEDLISGLREGVDILLGQLQRGPEANIFLRSVKRQKRGQDIIQMVRDIKHFSETGRKRPTTWAKPKDKRSAEYTSNTMGYMTPDIPN
ncbi:unnamed protein product [Mycena citricolor]|uniref:SWIM-type domain-containing protein n=1 Tax=Mycena citricolor TaxID=2018698 RepID=A0AAD2HD70_9AGAR|nr:unnamed protein product [Mycena citricolor]